MPVAGNKVADAGLTAKYGKQQFRYTKKEKLDGQKAYKLRGSNVARQMTAKQAKSHKAHVHKH